MASRAVGPDLANDAQGKIFRGNAFSQRSADFDQHGLRLALGQALGGQYMLDFRGADAKGQRAKSAMRAGVAVTANDRHARLGQAQFRADYMHNALIGRVHVEQGTPNSLQFFCSASIWRAAIGSVMGVPRGSVGIL